MFEENHRNSPPPHPPLFFFKAEHFQYNWFWGELSFWPKLLQFCSDFLKPDWFSILIGSTRKGYIYMQFFVTRDGSPLQRTFGSGLWQQHVSCSTAVRARSEGLIFNYSVLSKKLGFIFDKSRNG